MDMRELKGLEIAARYKLEYKSGLWLVPSQSSPGTKYPVTIAPDPSCTCEDFQLRRKPCKHIIAAQIVAARDANPEPGELIVDEVPKRPTYKQDWPAYNRAQAIEKARFQVLLQDLCGGIPEPARNIKGGQQPHTLKDSVFAMTYKVYSMFSARRFSTDLVDAHRNGFLSKIIPGAKVPSFHENPIFTSILKQLIAISALPLRTVEHDFAIDSTGFSSNKFERWFDHKYGITRLKSVWVKVHLACGVKTNVVTAVRILDKDAADCPQFVPLIQETKQGFTIGEVSADKAYASLENFEEVAGMGGVLYAAFKSSITGAIGGAFEKMFRYFQFKREEFLDHYHKRSNVESTISAIKRKFGDSVRSKSDTAMVNETLCKILCHNLTCLIQEQETLGIAPIFWKDDGQEEPNADVLPLVRPG